MPKLILLLLSVLLLQTACDSSNGNSGAPDSEIEIRSANGTTVISRADDKGAITMTLGGQRTLFVYRVIRTGTVSPVYNNVTDLVDYNFSNPNIAAIDANGRLTALGVGFTTLEVVYREDNLPVNDDKVSLDITVVAP